MKRLKNGKQKMTEKIITLENIKSNGQFRRLIDAANDNLEHMGYTEHGLRHVGYVCKTTANILRELGYDARMVELGAIAGWIHDIGNAVNRKHHGITGATMAFNVLTRMHMNIQEIALIIGAIGNHEEENGLPVNPISAALIIADKSDAHRSRVRKKSFDSSDIHDRVNMAIKKNYLSIDKNNGSIRLVIFMDTTSATMEFLQIYLTRVVLCEKAAGFLGCTFELMINDAIINRQKKMEPKMVLSAGETEVSEEASGEKLSTEKMENGKKT